MRSDSGGEDRRAVARAVETIRSLRASAYALAAVMALFGALGLLGGQFGLRGGSVRIVAGGALVGCAVVAVICGRGLPARPRAATLVLALVFAVGAAPGAIVALVAFAGTTGSGAALGVLLLLGLMVLAWGWFGLLLVMSISSIGAVEEALARSPEALERLRGRAAGDAAPTGVAHRRAEERDRRSRVLGRRRVLIAAAVAVGVIVLATVVWQRFLAPPGLAERLTSFEVDWNQRRVGRLAEYPAPEFRRRLGRALERELRERGWDVEPPRLADPEVERVGSKRVRAIYDVGDGKLTLRWRKADDGWVLSGFKFPPVRRIPDFGPYEQRFLAAWRDANLEEIASLFGVEERAQRIFELRGILEARGWVAKLPEPRHVETIAPTATRRRTLVELEGGVTVTLAWKVRGEGWELVRLVISEP